MIRSAILVPAATLQTKYTLSRKFSRNCESMPKTSTHILSTSRKYTTGFLVKRFGECCGSSVLTVACCWHSSLLILFRRLCPCRWGDTSEPFALCVGLRKGRVLPPLLFIFYINSIDSQNRVEECVVVGRINHLLFTNDSILLVSSESERGLQHSLDRFAAACDQVGKTIRTEKRDIMSVQKPKAVHTASER